MRMSHCDGDLDALHRDGFHFHCTCSQLLYVLEYANILMYETKKNHDYSLSYSLVPVLAHLLNNGGETPSLLDIYEVGPQRLPNLGSMLFQAILVKQVMHR
jgi:hypothetical protein